METYSFARSRELFLRAAKVIPCGISGHFSPAPLVPADRLPVLRPERHEGALQGRRRQRVHRLHVRLRAHGPRLQQRGRARPATRAARAGRHPRLARAGDGRAGGEAHLDVVQAPTGRSSPRTAVTSPTTPCWWPARPPAAPRSSSHRGRLPRGRRLDAGPGPSGRARRRLADHVIRIHWNRSRRWRRPSRATRARSPAFIATPYHHPPSPTARCRPRATGAGAADLPPRGHRPHHGRRALRLPARPPRLPRLLRLPARPHLLLQGHRQRLPALGRSWAPPRSRTTPPRSSTPAATGSRRRRWRRPGLLRELQRIDAPPAMLVRARSSLDGMSRDRAQATARAARHRRALHAVSAPHRRPEPHVPSGVVRRVYAARRLLHARTTTGSCPRAHDDDLERTLAIADEAFAVVKKSYGR